MRRASRIDATQNEIAEVLRAFGCQILYLHQVGGGCPDLLVKQPTVIKEYNTFGHDTGRRGVCGSSLVLVECKTRTGKLRAEQQKLIDSGWPIVVLRDAAEAEQWLRG